MSDEKKLAELLYLSRLKAIFKLLNENYANQLIIYPNIVFNPKPYKLGETQHLDVKGFPRSQTVCINNMCRTPEDGPDCPEYEIFIFWEVDDPRGATSFAVSEDGSLTRYHHEYSDIIPIVDDSESFPEIRDITRYNAVTTNVLATEEDTKLIVDILDYINGLLV